MSLVDGILAKIHDTTISFPVFMAVFGVVIALFPYIKVLKYGIQIFYTALVTLNLFTILFLYRSLIRNPLKENYGIIIASLFSIFCSCIVVVVTSGFENIILRNWYEFIKNYGVGMLALLVGILYYTTNRSDSLSNNQSQQRDDSSTTESHESDSFMTADLKFIISVAKFLICNLVLANIVFGSCFYPPDVSVIEILNSTEYINHYFLHSEGMYISVEPDWKVNLVENHIIDRSHSAMYTWYSKNGNAGHVSLQLLTDNTYLSHWPDNDGNSLSSLEKEAYRGIQNNVINDIIMEKGLPDHIIIFKAFANLNEEKILEWHKQNIKSTTYYHVFVDNCISYINKALKVGEVIKSQMLPFNILPIYKVNPSTRFFADCIRMEFYSSGYIWLDFLYLAHAEIFKIMIVILCAFLCWMVVETTYYRNINYSFVESKLNLMKKIKFW